MGIIIAGSFLFLVGLTFTIPSLRWYLYTRHFLKYFRKQKPLLSPSEKDVLEAGGVWFEKEFFTGRPNWERLLTLPHPTLTLEEQSFMDNQVETLCSLVKDWEIEQQGDLPEAAWNYIRQQGFWGLIVDKKYGGHGFSAVAHSTIITKIATRSVSTAITVMVPNSLGPAEFLMHFGNDEQKNYYLPRLVKGEEVGCFALTSTEAGSDATHLRDTGVVGRGMWNGREVIGIKLNFEKRYITLAPIATLIACAFKLYDPEHLIGDRTDVGITVALIPASTEGVSVGTRHLPMALSFMNGPVRGENVFIPFDFIPGGVHACGNGWRMMMECLSLGRGISLPGLATAASQLSARTSGAYAQLRQQFKRSIGDFEGIADALAHLGGITYLCNATRLLTAQGVDAGARPSIAAAITKYHLTELGRHAVNYGMDIHGGKAIQMGPQNYLGYLYQAIPISITVEGANILTRNLIIFGQGLLRCHPYLREQWIAAEKPDDAHENKRFDRALFSHIGFFIKNFARAVFNGLTGGRLIRIKPRIRARSYLKQLTRMSNAFVFVSDVTLLTLGTQFKVRESLSARLGDVLSHLYMAASVVKYYCDAKEPDDEWSFVEWSLNYCLLNIQKSFHEFLLNLTPSWIGKILRRLIFPWGGMYSSSKDALNRSVSTRLQQPSKARSRITHCCYLGSAKTDSVAKLEYAFEKWEHIKPIWKKIKKSGHVSWVQKGDSITSATENAFREGLLNEEERNQLLSFATLYWDVLCVDEFTMRKHYGFKNKTTNETGLSC